MHEWQVWNGGENPFRNSPGDPLVEATRRDGIMIVRRARFLDWSHDSSDSDITSYCEIDTTISTS